MNRPITDEVWRQLDPHAGRLPERVERRIRRTVPILILGVVLGTLAWYAGLLVPRVNWNDSGGGYSWSIGDNSFKHEVVIANDGWFPMRVLDVGRHGPGLELTSVAGELPHTLQPGERLTVELTYRVIDCAAVSADPWPVPVRVARPWGHQTSYVAVPEKRSQQAPSSFYYEYEGVNPYAVQWQHSLAEQACRSAR